MERTRTPVGTPGWLWVNLAAMGFSLGHTVLYSKDNCGWYGRNTVDSRCASSSPSSGSAK
jgi:hypothetical protein